MKPSELEKFRGIRVIPVEPPPQEYRCQSSCNEEPAEKSGIGDTIAVIWLLVILFGMLAYNCNPAETVARIPELILIGLFLTVIAPAFHNKRRDHDEN